MPGFTNEGSVDPKAIIVGDWAEVKAKTSAMASYLMLGSAKNGVLTISREVYEHLDTSFPRKVDLRIVTSVGMQFTADLDEVHVDNLALVLGKDFDDPSNYLYIGDLQPATYFTLHGTRRRPADKKWLEFHMHKCMAVGEVTLAGGDEAVPVPFDAKALDDSDGDYGGSSTDPLGWIYAPSQE